MKGWPTKVVILRVKSLCKVGKFISERVAYKGRKEGFNQAGMIGGVHLVCLVGMDGMLVSNMPGWTRKQTGYIFLRLAIKSVGYIFTGQQRLRRASIY